MSRAWSYSGVTIVSWRVTTSGASAANPSASTGRRAAQSPRVPHRLSVATRTRDLQGRCEAELREQRVVERRDLGDLVAAHAQDVQLEGDPPRLGGPPQVARRRGHAVRPGGYEPPLAHALRPVRRRHQPADAV